MSQIFLKIGFFGKNNYSNRKMFYFLENFFNKLKTSQSMYNKSYFILAALAFFIFYLFYRIVSFQVENFQTDNFSNAIKKQNAEILARTQTKENFEKYISTNAYRTLVAKSSQNKNLPGETIINVVSKEDLAGNANLDTQDVIANIEKKKDDPTLTMSNPDRWKYLLQNGVKELQ